MVLCAECSLHLEIKLLIEESRECHVVAEEIFYEVNEENENLEIMVNYEKRETITFKELMPLWWGKERYRESKEATNEGSP